MFHALATLPSLDGVCVLVTGDEEVGSPTSRTLIEESARGCAAAFVLEASADGGALKIARKGTSNYELVVHGRGAHAGLDPGKGANAGIELAHQVLALAGLADRVNGMSPTVTAPARRVSTGAAGIGPIPGLSGDGSRAGTARSGLVPGSSGDGSADGAARSGTVPGFPGALSTSGTAESGPVPGFPGAGSAVSVAGSGTVPGSSGDGEHPGALGPVTVTPTVSSAGTTTNTVPALARVAVDVRVPTLAAQLRVDELIRELLPHLAGTRLEVLGGPNRPPLEPGSSAELFALAQRVAAGLGLPPLSGAGVGGASDGNFTAGAGCPTLDGLGAVGGGAHAESEHVIVAEMPHRAALLAGLIEAVRS
jgi:glutamate carboxypeptidase